MGNSATWYYENCEPCDKCGKECIPRDERKLCDDCDPVMQEHERKRHRQDTLGREMKSMLTDMPEYKWDSFVAKVKELAESIK